MPASAIDGVVTKLVKAGGIAGVRQLAAVADAAGVGMHFAGMAGETSAAAAAATHLATVLPDLRFHAGISPHYLADDVVTAPLRPVYGSLTAAEGPGLGVRLSEEAVERLRVRELWCAWSVGALIRGSRVGTGTPGGASRAEQTSGRADLGRALPEHVARLHGQERRRRKHRHFRSCCAPGASPWVGARTSRGGLRTHGWTDRLPVVPPTERRVEAMLGGTSRRADEVVAVMPPAFVDVTVEKVAINAVMAGCRPEYLPVVLAAVAAAASDTFNVHGVAATTHFVGPVIVVNGPVTTAIGMNAHSNALGPR